MMAFIIVFFKLFFFCIYKKLWATGLIFFFTVRTSDLLMNISDAKIFAPLLLLYFRQPPTFLISCVQNVDNSAARLVITTSMMICTTK